MAVKLKCGSTFSSISWISLLRLPRISLSLAMSSTTSSVTFFTSTSGVNSWPCALPNRRAAKRHQAALAIVRMLYNPQIINARGRLHVDGRFETALFSNAFLARRLSIVDQTPAALQVGVALEYVLVERRLLQDAARVEQIGAHADQAQRDRGIAQPDRPEIANRIGIDVGRGSDADIYTDPVGDFRPIRLRNSAVALRLVGVRADLLDASRILEEAALDKYVFQRDAYLQRRRSLIYDGSPPREKEPEEDASDKGKKPAAEEKGAEDHKEKKRR